MAPILTSVVNGSGATNKLSEISISVASQWKNTCFFYCSTDIVWFVHLLLRFPIYRITHSESFMVHQMIKSILFLPPPPPTLPGWADSCRLMFLSEPFEKNFLTPSLWNGFLMVHNNNIYLYRTNSTIQFSNAFICRGHSSLGEGGGDQNKNGTSFPQVLLWNNDRH